MTQGSTDLVREGGKLSPLMARLRVRKAQQLIPDRLRSGRILDIGCGRYPYFLSRSGFRHRWGVDQMVGPRWEQLAEGGLRLIMGDVAASGLPMASGSFDAVTMLAVLEHIDRKDVAPLCSEIRRVLCTGGMLVLTTPPPWADPVLRTLASVGLSSSAEHEDHKDAYAARDLRRLLSDSGFGNVRAGYFEAFLNAWAVGEKA